MPQIRYRRGSLVLNSEKFVRELFRLYCCLIGSPAFNIAVDAEKRPQRMKSTGNDRELKATVDAW